VGLVHVARGRDLGSPLHPFRCSGAGTAAVFRAEEVMTDSDTPILDQPPPSAEDTKKPDVWRLVLKDMADRRVVGIKRYATPLQPFNGRDALVDLYQELLDAAVYARQLICERGQADSEHDKSYK